MSQLVNEKARIVGNEPVGPRLHLLELEAPQVVRNLKPGQFVHVKVPGHAEGVLRRPFSVYARDVAMGTFEILYQEVGRITSAMPRMKQGCMEVIGPIGTSWDADCSHALLVGGGVGAAPLFMLAEEFKARGVPFDVVLGAQTKDALVTRIRYEQALGCEPYCATDDGTYGATGFCTVLVEERLKLGCRTDGSSYDYLAVCGPEPLMRIVANMGAQAHVRTQVSMEKRMACGIGACLSCVVDTTLGKKRSCVDGPIFDAQEVVWQ